MGLSIIKSDSFITSKWSGGTTTELFIFPQTSNYQHRDFLFRLSTASVEVDSSTFTSLPGISRQIMILSGGIAISHKGKYTKQLNKFDVDEFAGDWETTSVGICTDFNLMTKGATRGNLRALQIEKEKRINLKISANPDWLFIYIFSGEVKANISNENYSLQRGDLLVLNEFSFQSLEIIGLENSEIVIAEISL